MIGGLVLPILGAFPDALFIAVSGLGASQAKAQEEVLVGMGLVAGSSVMVLTALWGSCLVVCRCDLVEHPRTHQLVAKDRTLTKVNGKHGGFVHVHSYVRVDLARARSSRGDGIIGVLPLSIPLGSARRALGRFLATFNRAKVWGVLPSIPRDNESKADPIRDDSSRLTCGRLSWKSVPDCYASVPRDLRRCAWGDVPRSPGTSPSCWWCAQQR